MPFQQNAFDEQAVQEILKRAMESHSQDNFLVESQRLISAKELDSMAAELGVPAEYLRTAQEEWERDQARKYESRECKNRQRRRLQNHALAFFGVNGLTMPLLYETSFYGSHPTALLFPLLWALSLMGHAGIVWRHLLLTQWPGRERPVSQAAPTVQGTEDNTP